MTVYANIWIKGGSRPLFFRPMGERGSAHRPSVIQIFAYAGYKRGVHTRFTLFLFVWMRFAPFLLGSLHLHGPLLSSALVFGWSFLFSWALLPSTTREGEPGAGTISPRSRDCADGTERLSFSSTPPERAGLRHVQARGTSPVTTPEGLEERSQGGTTRSREVATSFSFHWVLCK